MRKDHRIILTLAGSCALHGAALLLLQSQSAQQPSNPRTAQAVIELVHIKAQVPASVTAPILRPPAPLEREPPPPAGSVTTAVTGMPAAPGQKDRAPAGAAAANPASAAPSGMSGMDLSHQLLSRLRTATRQDAWQAYRDPVCTPAQRHSGLARCKAEAEPLTDQRAEFYAALFKRSFAHLRQDNRSFERDMDTAGALLAEADLLAALDPEDEVQAALVREQQAHLQQRVMSIDQRYRQFNLLRLIPISAKLVKGLQQQSQGG